MSSKCFVLEETQESQQAGSTRVLNFSPIRFDDTVIPVGRLDYGQDGDERLKQLRREHNNSHVFRREGADSILAVSVSPDAPLIGEPEMIRLKDHLGLTAALIRNALMNRLADLGGTSMEYHPIQVIGGKDLLRSSCPDGIAPPDWLSVRPLYEVHIRPIFFCERDPFIGALLNVRTTRLINRTASELLLDRFCLDRVYVGRKIPRDDSRIAPEFELLGCVATVTGFELRLTDCRTGIEAVEASDAWPSNDAFAACLAHVFNERAPEIAAALECQRAALRQGPAQLARITLLLAHLSAREYEMAPGATFSFNSFIDHSAAEFPPLIPAPRPIYVFDETGAKTHKWHDQGLNEHGPYTSHLQGMARPRICVICQRTQKVQVDQFLRTFFHDGVTLPPRRNGGRPVTNYFETGFCRKYALETVDRECFLAEDSSPDAYHNACQQALEKYGHDPKWDLALIQIEEAFHKLAPERNPYFVTKASFQSLQIPVQEFEIETTRKWGAALSFCLNNMGLATYAKLGGTPWLLKARSPDVHELVIGLGSAEIGEGRLGKRERFVGITSIFGGDGNYYLSNLSKAVSFVRYEDALRNTLRGAIEKVRTGVNWQRGDRVLLVFHSKFKYFSNEEVRAVSDVISEFGNYEVRHAFLHVSERHPYMLFDTSQAGCMDFETHRVKGQYASQRGRYLQIGNRDVLLFLTGAREVKRPEDGTPRPLLLKLHPDSSFTDMSYLSEQVYAFSCHSWRTFLPVSLPVTIQYPNLIADSLGKLSRLDRWNPDVMLGQIGKTPWFL
jgi:hypothetical protein